MEVRITEQLEEGATNPQYSRFKILYEYDANRNQIKMTDSTGDTIRIYDELNRTISKNVGNVSGEVLYKYDILVSDGNDYLTAEVSQDNKGNAVTKVYDKVVLEVDESGNQVARNLYGINLLMRDVDGDSYYYMYNGHADITALINADTEVVEASYYYDPFGNILESTGDVNNNITYAGYQYDPETEIIENGKVVQTGLYYLNSRMYDPNIARFLQEDTYRGSIHDLLSLNLYSYGANNPDYLFNELEKRGKRNSMFSLQDVVLDMIDTFRKGDKEHYSNEVLTEKVQEHKITKEYVKSIKEIVTEEVQKHGHRFGFNEWFMLQHYDGYQGKYKPFITVIQFDVEFSGRINK